MKHLDIPGGARIIIAGSMLIVIIPFLVWSNYAYINQSSNAQGQIIASSKTQQIQSSIDGIIEKIYVKEGENVSSGDLLFQLEKSQAKAAYESSLSEVAALIATLSRLKAEVYGTEVEFPKILDEYPEFVKNQAQLYERRQRATNDEISALNDSLALSEEELNLSLPLLKSGDIGTIEIIRIKRSIADIKGKISNKKNKYLQDSQADMTKAQEKLSTQEQELTDRKIMYERTDIIAPMNAIVKNIVITTQGARVRFGDLIMELVPFGDKLLIEAKFKPADISFIKKGQRASIKLDAYDYTIHGIFYGTVSYISPDTLIEKTPQGEQPYYRVQITLEQAELSKYNKHIEMAPGMTAQVDIMTGSKSVFDYLTKPIIKTFSEAFHER